MPYNSLGMSKMRVMQRRRRSRCGAARPATFVLLGILVLVAAAGLYWAKQQLEPASPGNKRHTNVTIPGGASANSVAAILTKHHLVVSRYSVLIAAWLDKSSSHLKSGVYSLSPGEDAQRIVDQISNGRTAEVRVTFPEGFTIRQMAARLQEHHLVNADEFIQEAMTTGRSVHCADGFSPPTDNLEGFLFPDTYDFTPDENEHDIINDMVQRFDDRVVKPNHDVDDWSRPVITASLIEREAEIDKDRPLIAAVIDNRLAIDMPLQVDATVEYALAAHKTRLMFSDLRTPSPYNTYLHRGLPPGAICNPGLPSIDAALHPAHVGYLFYVAGPGGGHIFSRTLAEQDRNIAAVRAASKA